MQAVREGVEDKPPIRFTIARKDVGTWMLEELVKREQVGAVRATENVVVTY